MATAAAVHIGRKTGDKALVAKALKMSEAVANQIFDDGASTKGYAFGTPESWFVDDDDLPVHRLHPSPLGLAARRRARAPPGPLPVAHRADGRPALSASFHYDSRAPRFTR